MFTELKEELLDLRVTEKGYRNALYARNHPGAGSSSSTRFASEAFRWTRETGMVGLGTLNNGLGSSASAVSGDGNVVVGDSLDGALAGAVRRAFRWTQQTGMVSLGLAPDMSSSTPTTAVAATGRFLGLAGSLSLGTSPGTPARTSAMKR